MKTLQKDGRTLKPEDIYLDLSKLSEEEKIALNSIESNYHIPYYTDWSRQFLHFDKTDTRLNGFLTGTQPIKNKVEITYPEFLQLFGESELTELPEDELDGEPRKIMLEIAEFPKVMFINNGDKKYFLSKDKPVDNFLIGILKAATDITDSFVFPKAPEGDFPDLSELKGYNMHCDVFGSEPRAIQPILAKYEFGYLTNVGSCKNVRPIQKQPITPSELLERLSKYEDISNYTLSGAKPND